MFPQNAEFNHTLGAMRQAEILREVTRYHLIQQATQGRPSGVPSRLGALLRSLGLGLWETGYGREATSGKVPA